MAAAIAKTLSTVPKAGAAAGGRTGKGARGAAAGARGAATGAAAAAGGTGGAGVLAVAAAGGTGAGAWATGADGGVGNFIVGAEVGLGGKLMRTVSFFGCTLAASEGRGGAAPVGKFGKFSAIILTFYPRRRSGQCQMHIQPGSAPRGPPAC